MKPFTENYHYCRYCKACGNNFRLYIRTRKLQSRRGHNKEKRGFKAIGWYCKNCKMFELQSRRGHNKEKRGFKAIGWYCKNCKMFETDEMISRRDKESIKDSLGLKPDEEYEKWRYTPIEDIKDKVLSK